MVSMISIICTILCSAVSLIECDYSVIINDNQEEVVIYNLIKHLSMWYNTRCNIFLHSNNQSSIESLRIFRILKFLASDTDFEASVLSISFDNYWKRYYGSAGEKFCPRMLFIIFGCHSNTHLEFSQFSHNRKMGGPVWLIILNPETLIESYFDAINLPFDVDLLIAKATGNEVKLEESYRVTPHHPLRINYFGRWSTEGLETPSSVSICIRRYDLEGIVLRTGIKEDTGNSKNKILSSDTEIDDYFKNIWKEIEEKLNFTSIYVQSQTEGLGMLQHNHSWSGLAGMIARDEIDIGIAPFTMSVGLSKVVDLLRPLYKTTYQLYFHEPGHEIEWNSLLLPFSIDIWIFIIVWLIIGPLLLNRIYIIACTFDLEEMNDNFSLLGSFFTFVRAFCQQGNDTSPNSCSCRIIYFVGYLMSYVLLASYSGALISKLTIQTPVRPFDSLEEFLEDGTYTLQMIEKSSEYSYFANTSDPLLQKIYRELIPSNTMTNTGLPKNAKEALTRACEDLKTAIFLTTSAADNHLDQIKSKNCRLMSFSNPINAVYYSVVISKNNPYKDIINHMILHSLSTGRSDRQKKLSWPIVEVQKTAQFIEIEETQVIHIQCVYVIGVLMSIVILLLEILYDKRKREWRFIER